MAKQVNVFVCGDRKWEDAQLVKYWLEAMYAKHGKSLMIHTADRKKGGVDTLAQVWADSRKLRRHIWVAQWDKFARNAGNVRNQQVFEEGQMSGVLAFHDDFTNSVGTAAVVKLAKKHGVPVYLITHEGAYVIEPEETQAKQTQTTRQPVAARK